MSWDVRWHIDTGGPEPASVGDDLNYTYNCGLMFRTALGGNGINDLDGKLAGEMIPRLRAAVDHMVHTENRAAYEAMNPSNGWGSHEGATRFLLAILANCEAHPKATIRVS